MNSDDWVVTLTFDVDPVMEQMDFWENELEQLDGSVARIRGRGVDVTVYASRDIPMFEAAEKMASAVQQVVHAPVTAVEVVTETEWRRRSTSPTMPELMSAAEIADELGISRQRVHQLRSLPAFPAPLADLRGGAVWDAVAVRAFGRSWARRPGRPRSVVAKSPRNRKAVYLDDLAAKLPAVSGQTNSREVVPNPDGGWDVTRPGVARTSAHVETQAQAIDRARQILRNNGGGELRIRGRNGQIRDSDTITPGKDPYPPKG